MSRKRLRPRLIRSAAGTRPAVGPSRRIWPPWPAEHHPGCSVQHCAEVVTVSQFGFTGRNTHPYRQSDRTLCGHCGVDRVPRRSEDRAHAVACVFEQRAAVRRNGFSENGIMGGKCFAHRVRFGLPPSRGAFDVGEQERDDAGCSRAGHGDSARRSACARSICSSAYVAMAPSLIDLPARASLSKASSPSTSRMCSTAGANSRFA